jgi:uncharacterized protein DUF5671
VGTKACGSMADDSAQLDAFIRAAKERSVDDAFLVALLRQNGWSERRIYDAFSAYYGEALGLPVPSRGRMIEYARDAFSYLLAFIALGAWAFAAGHLFYVLIDRWLPSGLDYANFAQSMRSEVAGELATILVAFPVYVLISRSIARGVAAHPETADSGVRLWLTYAALVVTAITMIGDCVVFLTAFLQGDLTGRFVLKALVTIVLAAGIFTYYLATVRTRAADARRDHVFFAGAAVVALAALVLGFFDFGSPGYARKVADDERRLSDLRSIADAIHAARPDATARGSRALPNTLADVPTIAGTSDPQTGQGYAYRVLAGTQYELCASFETEDQTESTTPFGHGIGHRCFTLDATKEY